MAVTESIRNGQEFLNHLHNGNSLLIKNLAITGNGREEISVWDPALNNGVGEFREGQFFIRFPEELSKVLPGSTLVPEAFLKELGDSKIEENAQALLGESVGDFNTPVYTVNKTDGENFSLRVFHGSANTHAMKISQYAKEGVEIHKGNFPPRLRAAYQKEVFSLMEAILQEPSNHPVRIVEDCIASADSIAGIISVLAKQSVLGKGSELRSVRIDVAVATTQGALILKEFAKQNGLDLELNIGYLAYGLSEGEEINDTRNPGEKVRAHANYMTYPEELKTKLGILYDFVVGDMGDFFKSMDDSFDKEYPWNSHRDDPHGDRAQNSTMPESKPHDSTKPTWIFLKNGGLAMRAFLKQALNLTDLSDKAEELIIKASRVLSPDPKFGYGVFVKDLPKDWLAEITS